MENINFFLNSGYTLNNGVELYAFGGVQEREAESVVGKTDLRSPEILLAQL